MNLRLLFTPLLCTVLYTANAQYAVATTKETYADLTGGTVLAHSSASSDMGYYVPANFMFRVFNSNYYANFNTQVANPVSGGGFMDDRGHFAVYDSIGKQNTIVFQCFENNKFKVVTGITTGSTKLEGAVGSRILKVQWKDLVYNNINTQKANFQIWFHEADLSVSYHYGANTLPPATSAADGGYTGIIIIDPGFTSVLKEINLEGKPSNPQTFTGITTFSFPTLDSIPPNGTVYTFRLATSGINAVGTGGKVIAYPNPAGNLIYCAADIAQGTPVAIYDNTGRLVQEAITGKQREVDVATLPAGQYTIRINYNQTMLSQQFIKQ